jgi:hypothetical protein
MPRSGDHRIRSLARLLATPLLLLDAALIGYAVWSGEVPVLRIAAVSAFIVAVTVVALFDFELVRNRRDHGAERAAQAKAYIELYAQRLREHIHASAVPVPRLPEEEALAARAIGDTTAPEKSDHKDAVEPEGAEQLAATARPALDPATAPVPKPAVSRSEEDLWDDQDAPTVVDLIAYEVRARLAEDERAEQEAAAEPKAATGS